MEFVSKNRKHDMPYFYKYTSTETAIKMLINKTLRGSSPIILNDPFDVARELPPRSFDDKELERACTLEFARLIEEYVDVSGIGNLKVRNLLIWLKANRSSEQLADLANTLRNSEVSEVSPQYSAANELNDTWKAMLPKGRILSLSETHNNPAMWAHYADNYKGVVLELECLGPLLVADRVIYSDAPLKLGGSLDYWVWMNVEQPKFGLEEYRVIFGPIELTKKSEWAYEREWRVLSFEKDSDELFSDYQVHPRTFTKVFLGKDVSPEDRMVFKNLIDDYNLSHIELYDMEIDHGSRAIKFKCA